MKVATLMVLLLSLFLLACTPTHSIEEVKDTSMIGQKVKVAGEVSSTVKIADISGYVIEDKEGNSIGVGSRNLPQEGQEVTVTGQVMRDTLLGFYILEHTRS